MNILYCVLRMERFKWLSVSALFLYILFMSNYSVSAAETGGKPKQYGEACNPEVDKGDISCNMKETLSCINETCQCADPDSMVFDTSRNLCVGLAGKPCVYHQSEEEFVPYRKNQCIMYSQCENKKCSCWSGFYQDENGRCLRKKDYMESCSSSLECDSRKAFSCMNGVCSCSNKTGVYIPSKGRCVGLPGEKCLNSYKECVSRFKCRVGKCVCKYKESEAPDGTMICEPMYHKYGKKCGKFKKSCGDEKDLSNLWCIDSKCRCRNPDYQIYDYESRACLSLVGGPCTLPSDAKTKVNRTNSKFDSASYTHGKCVQYAQCTPYLHKDAQGLLNLTVASQSNKYSNKDLLKATNTGRCECMENFTETSKGHCSLPFGASCDTRSNKYDKCDKTIPLSCVNFKCSCKNEMDVYEPRARKCKKSVTSLCKKTAECVKNAECVIRATGLPGRCTCRARYQVSIKGTCM